MSRIKPRAEKRLVKERLSLPRASREGGAPEYWVIKARSIEVLVKRHDELAEVGWRASGGVSVVSQSHEFHFFQAMVRA